ncbi:hypothetical protein KY290_032512 [Solanum tuberosum]|uniref:ABC transporter domain-containing protein n=1 Tax=Solanum tuberosum TaxID=4113 RepID=A0ABQ7UCE3_SOLTU|nr:hypothetical protein KY290_032512 [Solanum tuberosum]
MASAIMGPSGSGKTTLLNVLAVVLIHKLVMQKFVELVFGEKKRMSLACELIASPSVVFADEPATVSGFRFSLLQWRFSLKARCIMFNLL